MSISLSNSSEDWISKVNERISQLKSENKFYEYHQYFRTVLSKIKRRKEYAYGRKIIIEAILYLLDNSQNDSAIDLTYSLIELYNLEGKIISSEDVLVFSNIIKKIQCQNENRILVLTKITDLFKKSDQFESFNISICRIHWNEGDFARARYRVLLSNNGIAVGLFLVRYQIDYGFRSEIDLFISQTVLQYLCLKKENVAAEAFHTYLKNHPNIKRQPPFDDYPLLNFLWFILICIFNREESRIFVFLRRKYHSQIIRDSTFNQYLDDIGSKYFNITPTSTKKKSPLENLLGLFGNMDELFGDASLEPSQTKSHLCVDEASSAKGLKAILTACNSLYENQSNAQQIKSVKKFREGGPDPLDYINVYVNDGDPKHFHYITCGLSDLYDEFPINAQSESDSLKPSGFGFELTIRIKCSSQNLNFCPPKWPAILLQSLARYVYRSQSVLHPGDHVPWDKPLNEFNSEKSSSKIRNMILVRDLQLNRIQTSNGYVDFIQVYGVTESELQLVQSRNVDYLLNFISSKGDFGGKYLVTDIERKSSIKLQRSILERNNPSSMSGVTTTGLEWRTLDKLNDLMELLPGEDFSAHLRKLESGHIRDEFISDASDSSEEKIDIMSENNSEDNNQCLRKARNQGQYSSSSSTTTTPKDSSSTTPCTPLQNLSIISPSDECSSLLQSVIPLKGKFIEISLPISAAKLLPVAISNRIMMSYHFTFLHAQCPDKAITFVPANTKGSFVDEDCPFACRGNWLQVYISEEFAEQLDFQFSCSRLNSIKNSLHLPLVFRWPERHLRICLVSNKNQNAVINFVNSSAIFTPVPTPEMLQKLLLSNKRC